MKIYNFYFVNSRKEYIQLLNDCTEREAMAEMQRFLNEHHFKSYYTRVWGVGDQIWYDVGSHTEFFMMIESEKDNV